MRKSFSSTLALITLIWGVSSSLAGAQSLPENENNTPIILPGTSSSYNQNGFNLPTIPNVTGQDIVRGSGGISCQSSVGSGGPNFDLGIIGSNDMYNRDSTAVYGRITVPLGKRPKRVDCTKLYDLEISRLQMELQLMRAGSMSDALDRDAARQVVLQGPALPQAPRSHPFRLNASSPQQPQYRPAQQYMSHQQRPQQQHVQQKRSQQAMPYPPRQETAPQVLRLPQPQYPVTTPVVKCCQPNEMPVYYKPTVGPAYQPYYNDARRVSPPMPVRPYEHTQNLLRR